jgi:hypothetical protein
VADNNTPKISFTDGRNLPPVDQAAVEIAHAYSPDLILILSKEHGICIPGRDCSFAQLAQKLRTIADGLEKAHSEVQGLTFNQVLKTTEPRTDA